MGTIHGALPVGIRAQEARIKHAFSHSRVLVFGNTQGNKAAIADITSHARTQDIRTIVSLGRFTRGDCTGAHGETPEKYLDNYRVLLRWVKEAPETRVWLGIMGKYDYMPKGDIVNEILERHLSFDGTRNSPVLFYRDQNIFFSHFSNILFEAFRSVKDTLKQDSPALLFFAHSYYMGVNQGMSPDHPDYGPYKMEPPSYKEVLDLKDGEVYWISTGPNMRRDLGVNFAVYDPMKKTVTLQTLPKK